MRFDENGKFQLRRRTFDDVLQEAQFDFLFDYGNDFPGSADGEFIPMTTPNRNPAQVADGIWSRLIYKHVHKHFYN